jgi:hypothetical protein
VEETKRSNKPFTPILSLKKIQIEIAKITCPKGSKATSPKVFLSMIVMENQPDNLKIQTEIKLYML